MKSKMSDAHEKPSGGFPIVGIGASAGGLEAFLQLLGSLPLDTGMGFVLVQHLDPDHESALVQILGRATSLPVIEIADQQRVQPDCVYVIPRDTTLTISQGVLHLEPRPRDRVPHRPIDTFFESLSRDQGDRAVGVVLSGTATDGTVGLEAIKTEGGITLAQDDSAKHDSMPRSAVAAGVVDLVLSPSGIALELARISKHPYAAGEPLSPLGDARGETDHASASAHQDDDTALPSGGPARDDGDGVPRALAGGPVEAAGGDGGYKKILLLLHKHSGVDFSLYRSTTIQRRIKRRVVLTKHETLASYGSFLRGNPNELDTLYSDVLISVTSFFRNPEAFDVLKNSVLPALIQQRSEEPIRCWVLGCSTGQEAYSIAMAFVETADNAPRSRRLQVFATDLNESLLEKARHGLYAKSLAEDITPERLRRFFTEEDGGYRINKSLREMVVFARQNLISDPPFSRMDLVSCRNVLIYLEPRLQQKALPKFHYALKPGGFLLLGASESVGEFTYLFEPVDKKHKIFSRKSAPTPSFHMPATRAHSEQARVPSLAMPPSQVTAALRGEVDAQREADRVTVHHFAPPGVLVNGDLQVLQFRGPTGAFLEPPAGKASFDVLKMAREGLMMPLRAAIDEARKEDRIARREAVRVKRDGVAHAVNVEVIPLKNLRERCFLIVFEDADAAGPRGATPAPAPAPETGLSPAQEQSRIAELEGELAETREYLLAMQEQHEAAQEELQAANEEVQSSNEELQSINEEIETSKEELESSNEELTTVNEEMSHRNTELNRLNNDLVNLQASAKLAIVLLSRDLTIRRFSSQAQKQLDLLSSDVGRSISRVRHGLVETSQAPVDLEQIAAEVIANVQEHVGEVQDPASRWYSMRVRPYLTLENKVDGAVIVLVDIDAVKRSEQDAAAARDYAENTVATVREPLIVLDPELRVESANRAFYRDFDIEPKDTIGQSIFGLGGRRWDLPRLRHLLNDVLARSTTVEDFEFDVQVEGSEPRTLLLNARRVVDPQRDRARILLAIEDITERKRAELAIRESEERFRTLADNISQFAWTADAKGAIYWFNQRWYDYTGATPGEMVGTGWQTVLLSEETERVVEGLMGSVATGEPWEDTFHLRGKDGTYRWFLSRARPIRNATGDVMRWFGTNTDVTEQRQLEQRIARQAVLLEGESRRKDEFLAMLSHELRNPLAPIAAAVEVLKQHGPSVEHPVAERARAVIERQVANLTKLVNDLLEVSRVVSGRIRLNQEVMDLRQIVDDALQTVGPMIGQRKHTVTFHRGPEPVWGNVDSVRLEEVVINLLGNAAKYTPNGGQIDVWCERPSAANFVQIRVRDNGVGIEPELLPRIFELFSQADRSLARSAGGLGVGLSLASRLVDLHGGAIAAHSPPIGRADGQGSEFIVTLPAATAPRVRRRVEVVPDAVASSRSEGLRIVVVDDNVDMAEMLSESLQARGYEVKIAFDGVDGLALAQQWRPDVVLLDIGMPGLDGYEVARRLRADTETFGRGGFRGRLVALTGYGQDNDVARAHEAGFDAHLVKPYSLDQLETLLPSSSSASPEVGARDR